MVDHLISLMSRCDCREQGLHLAPLLNGLARIESILQRIFIAAWGAGSGRAAMHPTSPFAADRRRHAGLAGRVFAPQRRLERIGPVLRG